MSTKTATRVSMLVVLVLMMGLAGTAGASSMELGEGAVMGGADQARDIQETIWFQGFVGDAGTGEPVNATYAVTVRMYDSEVGGLSLWGPETHLGTVITDGWFNVELGSIVGGLPAFDAPPYYLQVTIAGEVLAPRLKLASVPSAFQSLGADDGLNLPYAGTHGNSGQHAFQITNTGPNICGYFITNNPGSTAASLYGTHNGTGAAVLGWHAGQGSAIKGVANGDGYAGEFDGSVVVAESLRVQGMTVMSGNAVVTDTLLILEGLWYPNGSPEPGYVLRSADDWGNAEWGPPNVIDRHVETGYTQLASSVARHGSATVTLQVPGPGYIVVDSQVWFNFDHASGTADKLYLSHSTSSTAHSEAISKRYFWEEPAGYPSEADLDRTGHVHSVFDIDSPGTYTYHLVGHMTTGAAGGDHFVYSVTTAIYYPYPIVTRDSSDSDVEFPKTGDRADR